MGRAIGPKCKLCRREGTKLFLKESLCVSNKCPLLKRKYAPGQHGASNARRQKLSEYGKQLREKQKAKRIYRLMEKQFHLLFVQASGQKGTTGENFLKLLEKRLDNTAYRLGFALSRDSARQLVSHGHITVNSRKVDIPSFEVKVGDQIGLKASGKMSTQIKERLENDTSSGEMPAWLTLDPKTHQAKVVSEPTATDLPQDIDTKLIVEFYSK